MRWIVVDTVGLAVVAVVAACIVGCVERQVKENLQPFIAVTGNYGVWSAEVGPTPAPAAVCSACTGTGKVLERPDHPQNKVYITCAACGGTGKPKVKEQPPCTSGTCPPVTRSIVR